MAGNAAGALKTAAKRVGCTVAEYEAKRAAGLKWCTVHKAWHPLADFPRDRTRGDGYKARCLSSEHGKPRFTRDPARERARAVVNAAVRYKRLPPANARPCTDCGHVWKPGERRHEYDHHKGYAIEHHLDVEPVCTTCHATRERNRRGGYDKRKAGRTLDGRTHDQYPNLTEDGAIETVEAPA